MSESRRRAALIAVALAWSACAQAEPLWFSDAAPAGWGRHSGHSHGGPVERGRGGVFIKRLWLRKGGEPQGAEYVPPQQSSTVGVIGIDGHAVKLQPFMTDQGGGITFAMPEEGFYNAYLIDQKVVGNTLEMSVLKAEVLKHSCSEGHDPKMTASRMPPRTTVGIPLEIVRERQGREDFHTRIASGDDLSFRIYFAGEPLGGAEVRLTTEEGWTKRVVSDQDGRAAFQMIRDYYPDWSVFDRRHSEAFLVTAEHVAPVSGELHGARFHKARYVATFPGSFHPSEHAYASYVYGLGVALFAAALALGGVFFYRLRQRRLVRERFDGKA